MKRKQLTPEASPIELLTIPEAASALRVSTRTVFRLIRLGRLRPVRIGGRTFTTHEDLRRLIAQSRRQQPQQR
jgi:excisionase family DNA binding protein